MKKRPGAALHSSWNWELISDKPLDWWVAAPLADQEGAIRERVLVASIMAGSGNDKELRNWQTLAKACQDEGVDALELNFSCPHMDRHDMGSNIGKDQGLDVDRHEGREGGREGAGLGQADARRRPTSSVEARGAFLGGADAIASSNTFPSLPLVDPETLEFEMNVDG